MLGDDLSHQDKVHKEEMTHATQQNNILSDEVRVLEATVGKLSNKVEKLVTRKRALKQGLRLVTSQRDHLQVDKDLTPLLWRH